MTLAGALTTPAAQPNQKVIEITQKPATLDADGVSRWNIDALSPGQPIAEIREIDSSIYGKLKGSPEPPVHFHEHVASSSMVLLVFNHRNAMPSERPEQAHGLLEKVPVDRDAFAQHAHSTRGRLFPETAMSKRREQMAVVAQEKDAGAGSDHPFLNHRRRRREIADRVVQTQQIAFARGVVHHRREPTTIAENPRPARLDDSRILDIREDPAHTGGIADKECAGNGDATSGGMSKQLSLVRSEIECFERWRRDGSALTQFPVPARNHVGRDIGNRHDDVRALARDEIIQEPIERLRFVVRRWIRSMAGGIS